MIGFSAVMVTVVVSSSACDFAFACDARVEVLPSFVVSGAAAEDEVPDADDADEALLWLCAQATAGRAAISTPRLTPRVSRRESDEY